MQCKTHRNARTYQQSPKKTGENQAAAYIKWQLNTSDKKVINQHVAELQESHWDKDEE